MSATGLRTSRKFDLKDHRQFVILGVLSVALLVILGLQFSGNDPDIALAAGVASEDVTPSQAPGDGAKGPTGVSDDGNPVLSAAVPSAGLVHNPFRSFWSVDTTVEAVLEPDLPGVFLEGTLVASVAPAALIDGEIHFVGDDIGGWELVEVRSRAILLRSPAGQLETLEMPLPDLGQAYP